MTITYLLGPCFCKPSMEDWKLKNLEEEDEVEDEH